MGIFKNRAVNRINLPIWPFSQSKTYSGKINYFCINNNYKKVADSAEIEVYILDKSQIHIMPELLRVIFIIPTFYNEYKIRER